MNSGKRLPNNEQTIAQQLVEHDPVAIGINPKDVVHYRSGIAHPTASQCPRGDKKSGHYVLAVGYGVGKDRNGRELPYWILKNSWGPGFGMEQGYYKIYRGDNSCGVSNDASIVTLDWYFMDKVPERLL